jgi:hypothetical protein
MSIGLAIIRLASESEPESLIMLPLELHPRIPPNPVSRVFFHLMTVAFVALYGSLLIVYRRTNHEGALAVVSKT